MMASLRSYCDGAHLAKPKIGKFSMGSVRQDGSPAQIKFEAFHGPSLY